MIPSLHVFWNYIIISMHLEDRLAMVRNCLQDGSSILFRSITSNRNPSDSNLLKTCFYHIKSLNESIQHDKSHLLVKKENYELPKISSGGARNCRNVASTSILSKTPFLLNKLTEKSSCQPDLSTSNLLKFSSSILLRNVQTPTESHSKQCQIRTKKKPHFKNLYHKVEALTKEQRFFQNQSVSLSPERIHTLGYYEASNIYKPNNIQTQLNQMKIVASKPQCNQIKLTSKHDLFLTNIQAQTIDFCVEDFIQKQLNKERDCEKVIKECDSIRMSKQINGEDIISALQAHHQQPAIEESDLYITIKDYSFVNDQSYRMFKAKHMQNWGDVLLSFKSIVQCMKHQKISYLKVKSDKLTLWSGKKISLAQMTRLLSLQQIRNSVEKVETICFGFLDRLKVKRIKQKIARKESLARWVCTRLKTFTYLRKLKREKKAKAHKLYQQLVKDMQWDTQIHLPSFSVDQFKRNTTQYLQSFENIYHSIWKNSSKHLILILPTLNQNIIKILQARIRVKRSLTIICPQLHETFPNNLPLSAQVLFSYSTLGKIEKAIDGRIAVLIPGCYQTQSKLENQLLLSEYLNVPLLCSLEMTNNNTEQKYFFTKTNISNSPHCIIPPNSTSNQLLIKFCELLMVYPQQKKWIIKLEGEFKGRGIATIKINPSKYFKKDNTLQQNKKLLLEHLKSNFKLKVKINFQNSLYMVEDFLKQLHIKGGIIQEEIQSNATFQVCFYKHKICQFQYLYRLYGTDYSNKIWLSHEPNSQLMSIITAIQNHLQVSRYFGHVAVTICKGANNRYYGIDLKLHQTYSSSMVSFIRMIQQKRGLSQQQAANIHHLPTKRSPPLSLATEQNSNYQLTFQSYSYLIIPNLVFTDIQQQIKARLIQEMISECWTDRHVKLNQQCRLFLSMGVDFGIVFIGKDPKRLKKRAIDTVRELNDRTSSYRKYRGKQVIRDVFQYGDIIRALSQIKQ